MVGVAAAISLVVIISAAPGNAFVWAPSANENIGAASQSGGTEHVVEGGPFANSPLDTPKTGVPMLVAYKLAIVPDKYLEFDTKSYPWIERTVVKGETAITDQELKEYLDFTAEGIPFFKVMTTAGKEAGYYHIEYREVPMSLEDSNAKAYKLDIEPEKYVTVRLEDHPWLKQLMEDSHRWIPIDQESAASFRELSSEGEVSDFKVVYEDGHSEFYSIRYEGKPLSAVGQR
ncbi:hypothetical protein [Candidatus Nitrososphaera sp. FF02]|uniref:hypothetical protein n=1 Tax=Candidatus Nitrososphaera sp. FF02 TaxID=3398226 RepID=UPI0039E9B827